MAGEIRRPGYIAILPSKVRYDPDLRPNAKLLYAEITALADDRGYCFARNDYFAKLFDLAPKSVSRLISMLGNKKYITVEVIRNPVTSEVIERRLWVDTPPRQKEGTTQQDGGYPPPQKEESPPRQKAEYNDLGSFNDIPPISPSMEKQKAEVNGLIAAFLVDRPQLAEVMETFLENRAENKKAKDSPAAIKAVLSRLLKYSGGSADVMWDMLSLAASGHWITVYEPKEKRGAPPGGAEDGGWL